MKNKKLFAILTLVCFMFTLMPVAAMAEETNENPVELSSGITALPGQGTEGNPYLITTLGQLIFFRDSVNSADTTYNAEGVYVALGDNINMEDVDWSVNIGDDCNYTFDGIFDGKGHTIKNLNSTETAEKGDGYICTGLFGAIYGSAVVKNLTIENVTINTGNFVGNNVGAVVGFAYAATGSIENVTVKGNININAGDTSGTGAIVGYAYEGSLSIKNCKVIGNDNSSITGAAYVGGIIGYAGGKTTITNCAVENIAVTATSCCVGGVTGILLADGAISGCSVKDVNLKAIHENWQESVAIAAGTITGTVTVKNVNAENVTVDNVIMNKPVGSVWVKKPLTPVAGIVAGIGDEYSATYTTLKEVIGNVVDGNTITVIGDAGLDSDVEIPENIIIFLADCGSLTVSRESEIVPTVAEGYKLVTTLDEDTITYTVAPIVYNVTFDVESIDDQTVEYNGKVKKPADPTKDGFIFAGWYVGSKAYDFTATVTSNLELVAKWNAIPTYTVTYTDGVEGEVIFADKTTTGLLADAATPAFGDNPTRTGYTFAGWSPKVAEKVTEDATYVATWTVNTYAVTFNSNEGSAVTGQTVNYGEKATAPTNPTRTNYTFAGWYSDEALTTAYDFETAVTKDITLYAKWTYNAPTYSGGGYVGGSTTSSGSTTTNSTTTTETTTPNGSTVKVETATKADGTTVETTTTTTATGETTTVEKTTETNDDGTTVETTVTTDAKGETSTTVTATLDNGSAVTNNDDTVAVEVTKVEDSVVATVEEAVAADENVNVVGTADNAVSVSATNSNTGAVQTNFVQPMAVSVPVDNAVLSNVTDTSKLTMAKVVTNEDGTTELVYMGGSYDEKTGTFNAKVDQDGDYILVEKADLVKIELNIDKTDVKHNDETKQLDVAPKINAEEGRTELPLRYLGEALGFGIEWNNNVVTITKDGVSFSLEIGKEIPGYGTPYIDSDRTMVSARYISEMLGANVIWDPVDRQVIVVK